MKLAGIHTFCSYTAEIEFSLPGTVTDVTETVQKPTFDIPSNQHHTANYTVGYTGVFTI
jgi:hypothetical protein